MRRTTQLLMGVVIGASLAIMAGCHEPVRACTYSRPPMKHLIFDRRPTISADGAFVRSEWPALIAHENPGEVVEYAEIVRDDYGRQYGRDDNYRRRFESVRIGRYRR